MKCDGKKGMIDEQRR